MAFLDALRSAGSYVDRKLIEKYTTMFKRASDSQLLRCYEQATSNPEIDMRIVEILEKEMHKRRLD